MSGHLAEIKTRALGLLARRDHAGKEIKRKLLSRGYDVNDVEEVIATLKAEGLQDDSRYAASYIRRRIAKGYGPVRISRELRDRGVAPHLAESSMAETDLDWREHLEAVRSRKFGHQRPADYKEQAKQSRFLQHRGFTTEQISNALR